MFNRKRNKIRDLENSLECSQGMVVEVLVTLAALRDFIDAELERCGRDYKYCEGLGFTKVQEWMKGSGR